MREILGLLQSENIYIIFTHVMSLKEASAERFFNHFREVYEKCTEYIRQFLGHFREILNFHEI